MVAPSSVQRPGSGSWPIAKTWTSSPARTSRSMSHSRTGITRSVPMRTTPTGTTSAIFIAAPVWFERPPSRARKLARDQINRRSRIVRKGQKPRAQRCKRLQSNARFALQKIETGIEPQERLDCLFWRGGTHGQFLAVVENDKGASLCFGSCRGERHRRLELSIAQPGRMFSRRGIVGENVDRARETPDHEGRIPLHEDHVIRQDRKSTNGGSERKGAFSRSARTREHDSQIAEHERRCVDGSPSAPREEE